MYRVYGECMRMMNDDITGDRVRDGGGMIIVPVLER
jgi:hypothetical protein